MKLIIKIFQRRFCLFCLNIFFNYLDRKMPEYCPDQFNILIALYLQDKLCHSQSIVVVKDNK